MSDEQFRSVCRWIGGCISNFLGFIESGFSGMTRTHWFVALVMACVVGFLCMKGMRADQRM